MCIRDSTTTTTTTTTAATTTSNFSSDRFFVSLMITFTRFNWTSIMNINSRGWQKVSSQSVPYAESVISRTLSFTLLHTVENFYVDTNLKNYFNFLDWVRWKHWNRIDLRNICPGNSITTSWKPCSIFFIDWLWFVFKN